MRKKPKNNTKKPSNDGVKSAVRVKLPTFYYKKAVTVVAYSFALFLLLLFIYVKMTVR